MSKQDAAFGFTKVRGYHPQLATLAETGKVQHTRLRGAGCGRGAASLLAASISPLRQAGAIEDSLCGRTRGSSHTR